MKHPPYCCDSPPGDGRQRRQRARALRRCCPPSSDTAVFVTTITTAIIIIMAKFARSKQSVTRGCMCDARCAAGASAVERRGGLPRCEYQLWLAIALPSPPAASAAIASLPLQLPQPALLHLNTGTVSVCRVVTHWQVNVAAPLMVTRALTGSLLLAGSSSIVFIGSSVSQRGSPGQAVYAASKAALAGAARTLAVRAACTAR